MYNTRTYRDFDQKQRLTPFHVSIKETDLYIKALSQLEKQAVEFISFYRNQIEDYIRRYPLFKESLTPLPFDASAPLIVQDMLKASDQANAGPMAAVAGAIAEFVGKSLLEYSPEVIVENGGDIFVSTAESSVVEIFAGESPLSKTVGVKVKPAEMPLGVCTSSATVGPSLSFGKADAVTVLSPSTALADAVATSIGNMIKKEEDIPMGLKTAESISEIKGTIIIMGEKLGAWGDLELIKL